MYLSAIKCSAARFNCLLRSKRVTQRLKHRTHGVIKCHWNIWLKKQWQQSN